MAAPLCSAEAGRRCKRERSLRCGWRMGVTSLPRTRLHSIRVGCYRCCVLSVPSPTPHHLPTSPAHCLPPLSPLSRPPLSPFSLSRGGVEPQPSAPPLSPHLPLTSTSHLVVYKLRKQSVKVQRRDLYAPACRVGSRGREGRCAAVVAGVMRCRAIAGRRVPTCPALAVGGAC